MNYNVELLLEKIQDSLKQGYGIGIGKNYKPWTNVINGSNKTATHIIQCITTGRSHDLFSTLEKNYCLILDSHPMVFDIREKVPLLDIEMAMDIADSLGVKYPIDNSTGLPIILTSDFLIDIQTNEGKKQVIRSVLKKSSLENKRTLEILEIERSYWEKQGIFDFKIVTENEIDEIYADNWKYLSKGFRKLNDLLNSSDIDSFSKLYLNNLSNDIKISDYNLNFERETGLEKGIGEKLFRYLGTKGEIEINLLSPIRLNKTLGELKYGF